MAASKRRGGICLPLQVWSRCPQVQLSAASAQQCTPVLLAGKVNVTVSSVAEDSHDLCDNRIAVTPLQGERDTVIRPLLVKVSHTSEQRTPSDSRSSPEAVNKMLRGSYPLLGSREVC